MTNVEKTRAMVKNIDPFEKKRRLAMAIQNQEVPQMALSGGISGAVKRTTARDERRAERQMRETLTPGAYLNAAEEAQTDRENNRQSWAMDMIKDRQG